VPKLDAPVPFARVQAIVTKRCLPCHSAAPRDPQWPIAPAGVVFDLPLQIEIMAPRIYERAVKTRTMPLNNKTMITEDERAELGNWVENGAKLQ
jgi:uncharacterized membrane protein